MNIDRLIDRIEKVLREGATDPVIHSLAKEYARYRTIIDQRLDQCVTLIRSGKKFAALELAEESPNALDLMERLSFAGDAKWKELCEEKSIYLGPNFTDDHVDMLEGLYGEKISEDHPVFREYRTAMRSRDEQRTFKILKTILRMNPDHEAAQRHFGQLSVKILEQRLDHIDLLIREGRKDELLEIMDEVETTDWVIPPEKSSKYPLWENALAVRQTYRKEDAKVRCEEILIELAQNRDTEQWKEALSLIGEFFELSQEYELESDHEVDDINAYNEFREWAEDRMEEDRDARALQALVARFKNRITEMKQAESSGGLTMENYLEFQTEINGFRKEFEDLGRADVPPEVMMDLQKGASWAKNRVAKMRSRTKKIWIGTAILTVAAVVAFLIWFTLRQERSDLLDSVAEAEKNKDPIKQWAFLEAFGKDEVQQKYLQREDADLKKGLASVIEKTFLNACSLDTGKKEAFLVSTLGKNLPFVDEDTLEQQRTAVVVKLCEDVQNTPPPPASKKFLQKSYLEKLWNFVERFRGEDVATGIKLRKSLRKRVDAMRPAYDEAMKDVNRDLRSDVSRANLRFAKDRKEDLDDLQATLTELRDLQQPPIVAKWDLLFTEKDLLQPEFPYYAYAQDPEISTALDKIESIIKSIQVQTANTEDQYAVLLRDIKILRKRVLEAYGIFKKSNEVDKYVLGQGPTIKQMETRFKAIKDQLETSEQIELQNELREVRDEWSGYAALTDASKKKITEGLLLAGEDLAKEIDAGRSSKPEEDLLKLAEMIKKMKSSTANQTKIPYLTQRRIDKLGDLHGKILSKMGEGTEARSEVIEASDLESYLAALEHARQVKAYQGTAHQGVQEVTANRKLFKNESGQLQAKLLFDGPEEVWSKIKTGKLGVFPENSQEEYEELSVIVSASGIRDVWRYKLNQCTPMITGATVSGQKKYDTQRKLLQYPFYAYGQIQQERIEEKFDETGKPVENPVAKVIQQGTFLINGKREGRLFEATHWAGAIKGPMLEEPALTAESMFVQQQIERRLDTEKRRVLKPLLDFLDALLLDQSMSPLFKAYMHNEICEIMFRRGDEWGASISPRLGNDFKDLKKRVSIPLKITDWMTPASHEALQSSLALFYKGLASRRYGEEAKFNISFLRELSTVGFSFAGYIDDRGRPRYLDGDNPPTLTWCLGRAPGGSSLQRFNGDNAVLFSPLLTMNKDLRVLYQKALSDAGVTSINGLGSPDELIPFRYSAN